MHAYGVCMRVCVGIQDGAATNPDDRILIIGMCSVGGARKCCEPVLIVGRARNRCDQPVRTRRWRRPSPVLKLTLTPTCMTDPKRLTRQHGVGW